MTIGRNEIERIMNYESFIFNEIMKLMKQKELLIMNYQGNKIERWKRHKEEILRTYRETTLEKQDRGRKAIQRHKVTKKNTPKV